MPSTLSPIRSVIRLHKTYTCIAFFLLTVSVPHVYYYAQSYLSSVLQTTITYSNAKPTDTMTRTPVYFLGIGGPNFMEDREHPAYSQLAAIGQEITTSIKPKAVVVFSAHWQGDTNKISVNVAEHTNLIYDFYGFPPHYYEYDYPNKGSPEVAEKVIEKLQSAGIEIKRVARGLDHGIWAGFMVAFDPKKNPLNVPIVQVSLYNSEDTDQHYRMGQALESLRDEGVLIIGAGMAVHNLRDYRAVRETDKTMPYAFSFDEALKEAATANPDERQATMAALMRRSDFREAHPSLEHILPMYVSVGAAGSDLGMRLWTLPEKSLSWAQYRFGAGNVPKQ